nr:PREDICTED: uncharacterized protein LOC109043286 [Bemisia tabaci]
MSGKVEIFKALTDMSMCVVCALRFTNETSIMVYEKYLTGQKIEGYDAVLDRKRNKQSPCIACLGLFRPDFYEETVARISRLILDSGQDSDTFNVSLSLPISFLLRAYSLSFFVRQKWPAYCTTEFWPQMSVKELWKNIITPKLAIKIKKNFNPTSKFDINVEYVYTDDEKEYRFLLNKFPGKF